MLSYFIDEETETQRLNYLLKVTHVVHSGTDSNPGLPDLKTSCSYFLCYTAWEELALWGFNGWTKDRDQPDVPVYFSYFFSSHCREDPMFFAILMVFTPSSYLSRLHCPESGLSSITFKDSITIYVRMAPEYVSLAPTLSPGLTFVFLTAYSPTP